MIEILESISQDLFAGDTKLHKMSSSLVYFYFQMAVDTFFINNFIKYREVLQTNTDPDVFTVVQKVISK